MISQTKTLKIKSFLPFNFVITKICVAIHLAEDETRMGGIQFWLSPSNIVFSNLIETKTNSKYLIGYLDKPIEPLALVLPKTSGYFKKFKVKVKNNKLMSFRIDDKDLKVYWIECSASLWW